MTAQPPEPPTDPSQPPPPPAYGSAPPPAYGSAPPPAYGGSPQQPVGTRPGELLDRFLARLIDGILVGLVNGVIVSVLIVGAVMGESATGFGTGSTYAASAVFALISTALNLGYFGYLESSRGQTVGKMIMKLRTVGPDGGNPSLEQALRRNIFLAIGLLGLIPVLGWLNGILYLVAVILIAVNINSDTVNRQGWHDHFAGETRVLKIG